jgi:hypothetical protein
MNMANPESGPQFAVRVPHVRPTAPVAFAVALPLKGVPFHTFRLAPYPPAAHPGAAPGVDGTKHVLGANTIVSM